MCSGRNTTWALPVNAGIVGGQPLYDEAGGSNGLVNGLLTAARVLDGGGPLAPNPIEHQQDQFQFIEVAMQVACKQREFERRGEHGPFDQVEVRYC